MFGSLPHSIRNRDLRLHLGLDVYDKNLQFVGLDDAGCDAMALYNRTLAQAISFSGYQFMIMVALSGLMIYKHRENIGRLLSGQEGKLKSETRSETK